MDDSSRRALLEMLAREAYVDDRDESAPQAFALHGLTHSYLFTADQVRAARA